MEEPPRSTPKRKRGGSGIPDTPPLYTTSKFAFTFGQDGAAEHEDGSASPRSKVAHKFRGLALGGGGGVTEDDDETGDGDDLRKPTGGGALEASSASDLVTATTIAKKRQKVPEVVMREAVADAVPPVLALTGATPTDGTTATTDPEPVPRPVTLVDTTTGTLQQLYPSINRLSESRSRARRRAGTPPLKAHSLSPQQQETEKQPAREQEQEGDGDQDAMEVVEPIRASLTWHDDEITVYDPDDEDDDGEGINGIGFRPSPALAYAREQKRQKQLADYRKREESEARARRSRRRRGSPAATGSQGVVLSGAGVASPLRRVRFTDGEGSAVATTS